MFCVRLDLPRRRTVIAVERIRVAVAQRQGQPDVGLRGRVERVAPGVRPRRAAGGDDDTGCDDDHCGARRLRHGLLCVRMAVKSVAPGGPGMSPRWTRGAKEAVGTAYASGSRVWYTVAAGILTEVFYPTVDTPQIRDLQLLVTDGSTFFHDERRHTRSTVTCVDEAALGFDIVNVAQGDRYTIRKTLIGAPHHDCVLMRTAVEASPDVFRTLQLFLLCA